MDEQNRYPHDSDNSDDDPSPARGATDPAGDSPSGSGDEHTRPIPPYQSDPATGSLPPVAGPFYGAQSVPAPAPKRVRGVTAGVLVAALVLGGAAGVGGSAAYHAFTDDGTSASPSDTAEPFQATKTTLVEDGTVEKVANAVLASVVKVNVTGQSGSAVSEGEALVPSSVNAW